MEMYYSEQWLIFKKNWGWEGGERYIYLLANMSKLQEGKSRTEQRENWN
jgi:hypothetical protein